MEKEIGEGKEGLLEGKVAIVTGGGSGLGKAIVQEFLREGAKVAIIDINRQNIEETVASIPDKERVIFFEVDIRDKETLTDVIIQIESKLGPVNILVNNAAVIGQHPLESFPEEEWQRIFDTNFTGARHLTQIIGGRMKEYGIKGSIIFITSNHTAQAYPGDSAYDVSKLALVGLMRVAALEWGKLGIRVNAVAPGGMVPTQILPSLSQEMQNRIPLGKVATPQEVAYVVTFVASDKASAIHGAEIRADGGSSIQNPFSQ